MAEVSRRSAIAIETRALFAFNTSSVTDMDGMFVNCRALSDLRLVETTPTGYMNATMFDLTAFKTPKVVTMALMFAGCESLTHLDLRAFDTQNVKDMTGMFMGCSRLFDLRTSLPRFKTDNVEYMGSIFDGCQALTRVDLSRFNTAKVTSMESMFDGCRSLTALDFSSFDTSNVTNMRSMLGDCSCLSSLTFGGSFSFINPGSADVGLPEPSDATYAEGKWCTWRYAGTWVRGSDKAKASSAQLVGTSANDLVGTWTWETEQENLRDPGSDPIATDNAWLHDTYVTPNLERCFLHVNEDALERVEFVDGELVVEQIAPDYTSVVSRKIVDPVTYWPSNLPEGGTCRCGGFFSGATYNYVATGQDNLTYDNSAAVFRFTKYTKDWEYAGHVESFGANTVSPYSVIYHSSRENPDDPAGFPLEGCCEFAEVGTTLHVRMGHTMYKDGTGINHQASAMFVIDEDEMSIKQQGLNTGSDGVGYVSHSLSQFLTTLDGNVYALDISDAPPEAGSIVHRLWYKGVSPYNRNKGVSPYETLIKGQFTVDNGGFEASETRRTVLSVGCRWDEPNESSGNRCDVWIGVTPEQVVETHNEYAGGAWYVTYSLSGSTVRSMTSYKDSSDEDAGTPFLVKINDDRFLVIWGVRDRMGAVKDPRTGHVFEHTGKIQYQFVDGNGQDVGERHTANAVLSDCQPVVFGNSVVWYAGDDGDWTSGEGGVPNFYSIDVNTGELSSVERFSEVKVRCEGVGSYYNKYTRQYDTGVPYSIAKRQEGPDATLVFADHVLEEGDDYTKTYAIDVANKKGTVTLTGKKGYEGQSRSVTFDILPLFLQDAEVTGVVDKAYTGSPRTQSGYTVKYNGETLTEGVDYTVSYSNNTKATTTNVGSATARFVGKGLVVGYQDVPFKIAPIAITDVSLSESEITYLGKYGCRPDVVVKAGGAVVPDTGFTVRYEDNVDVGTATVIVTGTADTDDTGNFNGLCNYSGTRKATFEIVPASMENVSATLSSTSYKYDGNAKEPTVWATYRNARGSYSTALTPGVDYTVTYSNNVDIGTATATITGKGNFTGSKPISFEITAADSTAESSLAKKSINGAHVELASWHYEYDGTEKRPSVTVRYGGHVLSAATDYDVAYSDNVNPGTATATVIGKGDYTGLTSAHFYITEAAWNQGGMDGSELGLGGDEAGWSGERVAEGVSMFRLYNQWSGEHFYTSDDEEFAGLVELGWTDEGTGWTAPATSDTPVFRLYNPYAGEHHYTMDADERDAMVEAGWQYEDIGWYSDDAETVPLFREYNPFELANNHNYTTSVEEHDHLVSLGWVDEGYAWYGM